MLNAVLGNKCGFFFWAWTPNEINTSLCKEAWSGDKRLGLESIAAACMGCWCPCWWYVLVLMPVDCIGMKITWQLTSTLEHRVCERKDGALWQPSGVSLVSHSRVCWLLGFLRWYKCSGEMTACGNSTVTCYFVPSPETDEDLFPVLEKLDHQCKRTVGVLARGCWWGFPGGVWQEDVQCRLVAIQVAGGGCVLVSCGNKRSPPTILQIFLCRTRWCARFLVLIIREFGTEMY